VTPIATIVVLVRVLVLVVGVVSQPIVNETRSCRARKRIPIDDNILDQATMADCSFSP